MQRIIKRGSAANAGLIFHIFAQDSASTVGAGKASIAFGSWACRYIRNGEAISGAITPEDITTIGTYAAPTANTNIRIKAVDNTNMIGVYEIQLHLDWVNTTNTCQSLTIYLTATGVAVLPLQIPLVAYDPQSATNLGLSNLDAAVTSRSSHSASDVWAVATRALTDKVDFALSSTSRAAIVDEVWDETLTGASHNIATSAGRRLRQLGDTVAGTIVDVTPTTTNFTTSLTGVDGFYDDQLIRFTTGALSGQVKSILTFLSAGGEVTLDEPLTSAPANGNAFDVLPQHVHPISQIADAVWDDLLVSHTAVGSFGKTVGDNVDTTISSRSSHSAADVWAVGARTLTSFGTLVSDIWANATRTLSAFGFTVTTDVSATVSTNLDATVSSRATPANVLTQVNGALDAVQSELTSVPTTTSSLRAMIQYLLSKVRSRNVVNKGTGTSIVYREDATTPLGTATFTDNGTILDKAEDA